MVKKKLSKTTRPIVTIARVWYYTRVKGKKVPISKCDYKVVGVPTSPAGTLSEWRIWARKKKVTLKVLKRRLWRG